PACSLWLGAVADRRGRDRRERPVVAPPAGTQGRVRVPTPRALERRRATPRTHREAARAAATSRAFRAARDRVFGLTPQQRPLGRLACGAEESRGDGTRAARVGPVGAERTGTDGRGRAGRAGRGPSGAERAPQGPSPGAANPALRTGLRGRDQRSECQII